MKNNFDEAMSKRTDAELIKIVTEQRNDYQPEAILAAEKEFSKRNLSQGQIETAKLELETKKQFDEKRASEPLAVGWKILTAIFPGIIQIMYSGILKSEGYDGKAKELGRWTMYGFCFYIGIVFLIMLLNKIL